MSDSVARIGFMQGRLSQLVDGRIQAFPWLAWRDEFPLAEANGLAMMEWTLDHERLAQNPLITPDGQAEIRRLSGEHGIAIPSLTGDCFMQAPWWKASKGDRAALHREFATVAEACAAVGIGTIVIPLVDNGRVEDRGQEDALIDYLESASPRLRTLGVRVVFESDFGPAELATFIGRLDAALFGVNYDMGNSAALGFDPAEELSAYGHRVINVHVKDRLRGGTTVPLGAGNADFDAVFGALAKARYRGNYILQTARAQDDDHAAPLRRYRDMTANWIDRHGA